ncbi:MAG: OmpA family protein [Bacteroidota bacterium]|nr:OmpA family protein [Bacteroidota bacterium]
MRRIFTLLPALFILVFNSTAQLGGTHNYLDTSYIAPRNLGQQSDFLNNNSNFPAKPRDMWQLGIFFGLPYLDADCPMAFKGAGSGISSYAWGGGLSIRKAIGYVVSIRASLGYYNMLGLDYQRNRNFNNHPFIQQNYLTQTGGYVHNYHSTAIVPAIEALISLNNVMFHNKQGRWNIYGLAGYTAYMYETKMDVVDASGSPYPFQTINFSAPRTQIRSDLRNMLDGTYETVALTHDRRPTFGNYNLRNSISVGFGMEYRIAKKTSLGLEYKRIITRDDYLDGWFRQSGDLVNPVFTSENDNVGFFSVSVNQNLGNSKRRIPPLWWMNPLEFAYSELNNPKHMKLPKVKLDDADGDGVTDQFDLEPNTPPGAPVDTHGVSKDTDGDGVPDYRDKELLTLQNCFPVDEDGVGNCPEPECCKELRDMVKNGGPVGDCKLTDLPSVQFKESSVKLTKEAQSILNTVANQLKANPTCKVKVSGHGASNKAAQQLSWDRVNAMIRYLVERQGISNTRIIFEYGTEGDAGTVDLMGTTEEGPNSVPAPHPNLQKIK